MNNTEIALINIMIMIIKHMYIYIYITITMCGSHCRIMNTDFTYL